MCFGLKYKRELYKRKISSIRENINTPSQAEGVLPYIPYFKEDFVKKEIKDRIKLTMLNLKVKEKKRDDEKADERLRITAESLLKHNFDNDSVQYWGWLPKSVFDAGISSRALGLLTMLTMNSNTLPVSEGRRVTVRIKPSVVLNWLKIANRNQAKTIRGLLDELENSSLIKVTGDEIELLFPTMDEAKKNGGFCKVYTNTYNSILDHSHGVATLNRIAVYVGVRSLLYEDKNVGGSHWNVVYHNRSDGWIGEKIDLSEATTKKIIQWFIDNDILAWNLLQNRNKYHNKIYYLSEPHHVESLVYDICNELNGSNVLRVVA